MKKRLLAALLAAAMVTTMAPAAFAVEDDADPNNNTQVTENVGAENGTNSDIPAAEDDAAENTTEKQGGEDTKATASVLQSAIDAAGTGDTVTMSENEQANITINKSITLDLAGHTLTNAGSNGITLKVTDGATVTVQNGAIMGGADNYNIQAGQAVNSTANLTLKDVTATAGNSGSSMIDNWGTLTIESGTYTGGMNVVKSEEGSKLTITGGTFNLESAVAWSYTGVVMNYGDAVITGGTFNQNATTPYRASPTVVITAKENEEGPRPITKITGGTFVNKHTSSTAKIFHNMSKAYQSDFDVSGGTFNKKVTAAYCPNYVLEKDSTGMYSIGAKAVAVQVKAGSDYVRENYANMAQAVKKASKNYTVKLLQNVTEDINIPASKVVNLDLNGHTLTNASGDTITVAAKGTLTIKGEGTVDNVTHAKAAIVNNGTVTLNGGTYTRSKENPENNKDDGGGNSYYTILNDEGGNMTINSGVTVTNVGHYSSMIRNGGDESSTAKSVMTINGGTFSGGINTVKNDDYGVLTINDGNFSNTSQFVVMNWHDATINGGTFSVNKSAEAVLQTAAWTPSGERSVGKMTINGGTFKGTGEQAMIEPTFVYNGTPYHGTASVSGGVFTADVKNFCAPGYKTELTNGVYVVKAGTNDAISAIDEAIKDGATEAEIKAAVDAVVSTPNATLANSSTTMDKLAKLEDKITNNQITVETSSNVAEVTKPAATNAKLSADPAATAAQNITIDVASSTASTEAAKALVGEGAKSATAMDITMKLNSTPIQPKAPVVLTFNLPDGWDNAQIVYMNGENAEKINTTVSNGKISGVFNHFSTYVLVQTAAADNPNEYEIILTPDKEDVSAGDTLTYTVSLKHTAAGDDTELKGQFEFTPAVTDGLLALDNAATTFESDVVFGLNSENHYQFNVTNLNLAVGDTKAIGKLVYKVGAYGTNNAKVEVLKTSTANVTNDGRPVEATVKLTNEKDVTYHITKATFKQGAGTALENEITGYVRYGTNEVYTSLEEQAKGSTVGARLTVPELNLDTTGGTTYRVKDTKWHLNDAAGAEYPLTDGIKTDVTFVENLVKLAKVDIPKEGTNPLVEITDKKVTRTESGNSYVDQGTDLKFKLTDAAAPDPGMENVVKVKVDGAEVTVTDPDTNGIYTVDGSNITGEVTFEITQKLALTAADIKIFTKTDDATGVTSYREYSTYSGKRTLVLFKGDENATYVLKAEGNQPAIYKTSAYEGGYTYAVLVDPATTEVSKNAMLTYLVNTLKLNTTKDASVTNTVIYYDWNTNGRDGAKLADAQATRDFMNHQSNEMYWTPSDELLLKADVITLTGDDKHVSASYEGKPDGYVSTDDVNTFLYLYAGLAYKN